ncbi:MAG: hypothetical protein Q9221_001012 [Calogaya cf. arnoldii]
MVVLWYQDPEFLCTSNRTIVPGDPPRPIGPGGDTQDVTSFHPGQLDWSPEAMPNILYVYKSPQRREDFYDSCQPKAAKEKLDAQGRIMMEEWPEPGKGPRPLLDYPHLPDRIGTNEWWWVLEAWRRYDPRIRWVDIQMRQCRRNRKSLTTMQHLETDGQEVSDDPEDELYSSSGHSVTGQEPLPEESFGRHADSFSSRFSQANSNRDSAIVAIGVSPSDLQTRPEQTRSANEAAVSDPLLERVAESLWMLHNSESLSDPPAPRYGSVNPAHQSSFAASEIRFPQRRNKDGQTYDDLSG